MAPAARSAGSGFEALLKSAIGSEGDEKVSRGELFAAEIGKRLAAERGEKAAQRFAELFAAEKSRLAASGRQAPVRKAAETALCALAVEGGISQQEAARLGREAARAAGLEDGKPAPAAASLSKLGRVIARAEREIEAFSPR